jgi:hypothetical protein
MIFFPINIKYDLVFLLKINITLNFLENSSFFIIYIFSFYFKNKLFKRMKIKFFILLTFIVIIWNSSAQSTSYFPFNQQNFGNSAGIGFVNGHTMSPVTFKKKY